jgi:hypothetical protein
MKGSIYIYNSNADVPAKVEYPTIDAAVAALVAGDVLNIESGDYTLLAGCDITKPNVAIVGIGEVIIRGAATATYCFKTVLGALTASSEVFFKNIDIIHDGNSTQYGIYISNTGAGKKLIVDLTDVDFENDSGDSIHATHGDTSNAIRLYVKNGTIEGPVNVVVKDNGDRFRFEGTGLRGGFVSDTGAYTAEISFRYCTIKHAGVTGGATQQRIYSVYSCSETDVDQNTYALVDTDDLAGSQTETVMLPTS